MVLLDSLPSFQGPSWLTAHWHSNDSIFSDMTTSLLYNITTGIYE